MYDEEENQRRIRNSVDRSQSVDTFKEVRLRKWAQNRIKNEFISVKLKSFRR